MTPPPGIAIGKIPTAPPVNPTEILGSPPPPEWWSSGTPNGSRWPLQEQPEDMTQPSSRLRVRIVKEQLTEPGTDRNAPEATRESLGAKAGGFAPRGAAPLQDQRFKGFEGWVGSLRPFPSSDQEDG